MSRSKVKLAKTVIVSSVETKMLYSNLLLFRYILGKVFGCEKKTPVKLIILSRNQKNGVFVKETVRRVG